MMDEIRPDFDLFDRDELSEAIAEATAVSPTMSAAVDDALELRQLIDHFVRTRKEAGLTQSDIAGIMGVRQPTVSQFETESSDPRISTLQRYARAIGCRVSVCIVGSSGVYSPSATYQAVAGRDHGQATTVELKAASQATQWRDEARSKYALAR